MRDRVWGEPPPPVRVVETRHREPEASRRGDDEAILVEGVDWALADEVMGLLAGRPLGSSLRRLAEDTRRPFEEVRAVVLWLVEAGEAERVGDVVIRVEQGAE